MKKFNLKSCLMLLACLAFSFNFMACTDDDGDGDDDQAEGTLKEFFLILMLVDGSIFLLPKVILLT